LSSVYESKAIDKESPSIINPWTQNISTNFKPKSSSNKYKSMINMTAATIDEHVISLINLLINL
jgi:hypothetical protein